MNHHTSLPASAAVGIALGALVLFGTYGKAWPHDAPKGWKYPYSCCSGVDCREVTTGPKGTVREKGNGYVIAKTGEELAYGDSRIKDSPDGSTHWCSVAGLDDSRTICLFVPPRSY